MGRTILVPYGSAFLQLTVEEFEVVQARGLVFAELAAPAQATSARDYLLTSAELGKMLGVTAEYCEQKAKDRQWPSLRVGRYLRFDGNRVLATIAECGGC